jgi:hypothetical protein
MIPDPVQPAKETVAVAMAVKILAVAVAEPVAQVRQVAHQVPTQAEMAAPALLIVYRDHLITMLAVVVVAHMMAEHQLAVLAAVAAQMQDHLVAVILEQLHKVQQTLVVAPAAVAIPEMEQLGTTVAVVARVLLLFLIKVLHSLVREAQ